MIEGAYDKAEEWTQLTADERSTVKAQYEAAGISLIVSLFGSTDAPTSTGADPVATAKTMAAWVIEYGLDGCDVRVIATHSVFEANTPFCRWTTQVSHEYGIVRPQLISLY